MPASTIPVAVGISCMGSVKRTAHPFRCLASAAWLVATAPLAPADQTAPADLLFRGGTIYTVNSAQPRAEAVAVRDGRIVFVGPASSVAPYVGDATELVELGEGMLMPGFHDSHAHPMRAGTRFLRCQLAGLEWPDAVLARLGQCAAGLQPGQWLRGTDLTDKAFDGPGPRKAQLDEIAPDRPAYVSNRSGFAGWANSVVLEMAGIDAATPDPAKGRIERDPETGEPSGTLRDNATGAAYRLASRYAEAELREALRLASAMANRFGITSVNAAALWPDHWAAYVAADRAGEMTLRVQGSLSWNFEDGLEQLGELRKRRHQHTGDRFRADAVKLFLDGNFQSRSASVIEPYVGTEDDYGLPNASAEDLAEIVTALDAEYFQVHVHAVGDRVVRHSLDAIEHAIAVNGPRDRRHHFAHIPLIHPDDLPRFAELGVTADFQALWAYMSDERSAEARLLGPERAARMVAIRSMLDTGAHVVLGSDWISESMNPLVSIQIAVTRRPPDASGPAWLPEQRITLNQALRAYTIDGAWLANQEELTGSIEVGKAADLAVLERSLFEVDPMEISQVRVLRTFLEGTTVYRRTWSQP